MSNENARLLLFNQMWEDLDQSDEPNKSSVKNNYNIEGKVVSAFTNNQSENKLTIVISVDEKNELWLNFPTLLPLPFVGKDIKVCGIDIKADKVKKKDNETDDENDNNKRRIYINNAKYEKLQVNGYIYNEEFKSYVLTNALKKFKVSKKKLIFVKKTIKMLLIVPINVRSQGEADFLFKLHPHAWKTIIKERINTRYPEKIAEGFKAIADNIKNGKYGDINCLCVISGGGPNVYNFNCPIVCDAAEVLKAACGDKVYMISGVGHVTDNMFCNTCFDYVTITPTDAAYFLNRMLGFYS